MEKPYPWVYIEKKKETNNKYITFHIVVEKRF